ATPPPSGRGEELGALARAVAATLRREGPKRGSTVLEMLHRRGLSESEALSVVTVALSTGALVRDPPWSTMLQASSGSPHPNPSPGRGSEGRDRKGSSNPSEGPSEPVEPPAS